MADEASDGPKFATPGGAAGPAAELSADGQALVVAGQSVAGLLDALVAADLLDDAVGLAARALPPRRAVWWAARCAGQVPRPEPAGPPSDVATARHAAAVDAEAATLRAVEKWCSDPTDPHRRAAKEAADGVPDSPAGLAGLACFLAEGSIAPPDCPAVPAPPGVCGQLVGAAVGLAAVRREPEKADDKRRAFVGLARAVDDGSDRWPDAPRPVSPPPPRPASGPLQPPKPPVRRGYY